MPKIFEAILDDRKDCNEFWIRFTKDNKQYIAMVQFPIIINEKWKGEIHEL